MPVQPGSVSLTVATFNIHSGVGLDGVLDLPRIADALAATGADVIGLQEVDRHRRPASGHQDQAGWLAGHLGMTLAFGANLDHDPGDDGLPRRQYGTAILSRHPILESVNTLLPCRPGSEQRGLLSARVEVAGAALRVLCTHFQHDDADERVEQARAVVESLGPEPAGPDSIGAGPAVLLGDLNAHPGSAAHAVLCRHFRDAWADAGVGPGLTFEAEQTPGRIDYVLTAGGVRAHRMEVVPGAASDHWLLVADLTVPARA